MENYEEAAFLTLTRSSESTSVCVCVFGHASVCFPNSWASFTEPERHGWLLITHPNNPRHCLIVFVRCVPLNGHSAPCQHYAVVSQRSEPDAGTHGPVTRLAPAPRWPQSAITQGSTWAEGPQNGAPSAGHHLNEKCVCAAGSHTHTLVNVMFI